MRHIMLLYVTNIIGSRGLSMVQGDDGPPYRGGCKQMPKGIFEIIIKT